MAESFLPSIAALVALMPLGLLSLRRSARRDWMFWTLLGVALAGPLVEVSIQFWSGWRTGLAPALWICVTASLAIFALLAAVTRNGWRLAPLLSAYLILFALIAVIWQNEPAHGTLAGVTTGWIEVHIVLSVVTYGLLTIAAVAGAAGFLQERALKAKGPGALSGVLPPMAEAEKLQVRLLLASAVILGCGVLTGMGGQYVQDGRLLALDHKTVLSLVAFVLICVLLIAHYRTGVRGRRAARIVLVAYLCLTLAYPGVKFVTDVVLA